MIIVGDVHGKINEFYSIIQKYPNRTIICVGDFGFEKEHLWFLNNMDTNRVKLLFGNHEYYPYLNERHSLGDYAYWSDLYDTFFVRGANSIDKHLRTQGVDWFEEEEINHLKWYEVIDEYEKAKPRIMITHDCPETISHQLIGEGKSITRQALDTMFAIHKPELWVFGHHHRDFEVEVDGTTFVCLNELTTLDLEQKLNG